MFSWCSKSISLLCPTCYFWVQTLLFMLPSLFVTFLQRFFPLSDSVSFCVTCSQAQLQAASSPGQRSEAARLGIEPDADPQLIISSPQPQPPGLYTDSRSLFSFPLFISACLGGNTDPSRLSVKYRTSWWKNSTTSFQLLPLHMGLDTCECRI